MLTFGEFSDLVEFDKNVRSCASLFAETSVEPEDLVESVLEDDLREGWRDWISGAKDGMSRWGSAIGQLGKSVMDGGLRAGFRQASDTLSGPSVKFDKAVKVLTDLAEFLKNNDMTKDLPSAGKSGYTVGQYIQGITSHLLKEKDNIPKMQQAKVSQTMAPRDGGESLAAANAAAAPVAMRQVS